jgi:hypothetical protein
LLLLLRVLHDPEDPDIRFPTDVVDLLAWLPFCAWNPCDFCGRSLAKLRALLTLCILVISGEPSESDSLQYDFGRPSSSSSSIVGVTGLESWFDLLALGLAFLLDPDCWLCDDRGETSGERSKKLGRFFSKSASGWCWFEEGLDLVDGELAPAPALGCWLGPET